MPRSSLFAYGYGHLFIYAGITAASVGIAVAIESATHALENGGRAALCGGLAVALFGITVSQSATMPPLPAPVQLGRVAAIAAVVIIGLLGGAIATPWLTSLVAAVLALVLWQESA